MNHAMPERGETSADSRDGAGLNRRAILSGTAAGFVLAASGVYMPEGAEGAEEREGALGGELGGRRGKDRKRRHRHGARGDKKDKGRRRNDAPKSRGLFRATALTVVSAAARPLPPMTLHCTFYYRLKTGLDDYGPPVASVERTIAPGESFRYAPDRFRVGVLIKHVMSADDFYADVRNVSFWLPRGSLSSGPDLDPPSGKTGHIRLREQAFDFGESQFVPGVFLKRKSDSDTHIEWELTVTQL